MREHVGCRSPCHREVSMNKYKAVLRVEPLTDAGLKEAGRHQSRIKNDPHIDPTRTKHNQVIFGTGNVVADVMKLAAKVPKASKRSTKNCAEMLATADRAYFDEISPGWEDGNVSPALKKWIKETMAWVDKTYPGQVAAANLHLDEQAPHLHIFLVPIQTYKIKFRRGSKMVTRINYGRQFTDTRKVLSEAKLNHTRDTATKLGRMQTSYAEAMAECGLERGIRNSGATHRKIRKFQAMVATPLPEEVPAAVTYRALPALIDLTLEKLEHLIKDAEDRGVAAGRNAEHERLEAGWAKAKDYDYLLSNHEKLKEAASHKDEEIQALIEKNASLEDQITSANQLLDRFKPVPLESVATRMEHNGPMKWRNAIEMAQALGEFDFNQSVAWLHATFGTDATVATLADLDKDEVKRIVSTTPVPLTPTETLINQRRKDELEMAERAIQEQDQHIRMLLGQHGMQEEVKVIHNPANVAGFYWGSLNGRHFVFSRSGGIAVIDDARFGVVPTEGSKIEFRNGRQFEFASRKNGSSPAPRL